MGSNVEFLAIMLGKTLLAFKRRYEPYSGYTRPPDRSPHTHGDFWRSVPP
jgi:hypothetical protein